MVKYLNNRGNKSRTTRQQNQAQANNSGQTNVPGGRGQPAAGGSQNQPVLFHEHPGKSVLTKMWGMTKNLLTYQPTEYDDDFSLGERSTENTAESLASETGQAPAGPGGQAQNPQNTGLQGGNRGEDVQEQGRQGGGASPAASGTAQEQAAVNQGQTPGNAAANQAQGNQAGQQQGAGGQAKPANSQAGAAQQPSPSDLQAAAGNMNQPVPQTPPGTAPYFQQVQAGQTAPKQPIKHTQQGGTPPAKPQVPVEQQVHFDLNKNLQHVQGVFDLPNNKGFTVREFIVGFEPPQPAFLVFTEGLADKNLIDKHILDPLMIFSALHIFSPVDPISLVKQRLVTANQVDEQRDFSKIIEGVLTGTTALFIQGSNSALLIETKGWEHRGIDRPQVENVVRGPQEGFNEVLISNMALVRSRLRTETLVSETFKIGRLSKADVAVMYLRDVANPAIVTEVRKRINTLGQVDYIPDTGILEQFIEDNPFSLTPQTLSTERPDRVAAYLLEGHVAILMSSTPFAMVVPATFWSLMHSAEDSYVRYPYGALMRIVRVISLLIAMFLPAAYVAIVNYHQNMLPPDLLFSIAAAREKIPFPAVVEIIIMEISFELIREAGIRIPSIIGTTIGIVGALILGQAAVQAALISPLVIIIVALTGLGSFAIPNYSLAFNVRLVRFAYIGLATLGGFFTISLGMVVQLTMMCGEKSFGVPIMSPASPNRPSKDTLFRSPVWVQETRPSFLRPLKQNRQAPVVRSWDPKAAKKRKGGEQS